MIKDKQKIRDSILPRKSEGQSFSGGSEGMVELSNDFSCKTTYSAPENMMTLTSSQKLIEVETSKHNSSR